MFCRMNCQMRHGDSDRSRGLATADKFFSKEVTQKQATPFPRQYLLTARNRFRPNFQGWGLDEI